MTLSTRAHILSRSDRGESVSAISLALGVTPGYVYGVLRVERPNRPRKARVRTSTKPERIRALAAIKTPAARIAKLVGCSKAYVYRHLL